MRYPKIQGDDVLLPLNRMKDTRGDRDKRYKKADESPGNHLYLQDRYCPFCYRDAGRDLAIQDVYECPCGAQHLAVEFEFTKARRPFYSVNHNWDRTHLCIEEWENRMKKGARPIKTKTKNTRRVKTRTFYALQIYGQYVRGVFKRYHGSDNSGSCNFGKSGGVDIALFRHPPLDFTYRGMRVADLVDEGAVNIVEVEIPDFAVQPVEQTATFDERLSRLEDVIFGAVE